MPRKARLHAESGIYHVMLRGINGQQIFEDEEDNQSFLQNLREYKPICGYKLFAYCLMGNHIHLLIQEGKESLGQVFKRIGVKYVYWYNMKYQRDGHLFQDRFKSEVVEDSAYFSTVIRYIHQNPIQAGICNNPEEYPYSSFREYLEQSFLIDLNEVEKYISRETVVELSRIPTTEKCLEISSASHRGVTDQQAKQMIKKITRGWYSRYGDLLHAPEGNYRCGF